MKPITLLAILLFSVAPSSSSALQAPTYVLQQATYQDPLSGASAHRHRWSSMSQAQNSAPAAPAEGEGQEQRALPLVNFEVNRPTRIFPIRQGLKKCTIVLVKRAFENSYGNPSLIDYSPSQFEGACADPSKWVALELSQLGTSVGSQFDRLGSVQIQGTEVWRGDNPEPVSGAGIEWLMVKEMGKYYDLFRKDGKIVFDYPNIVNDVYTGILTIELRLTAYVRNEGDFEPLWPHPGPRPDVLSKRSPVILPLSKRTTDASAYFTVGGDTGDDGITKLSFPQNVKNAVVEIYASGTANDVFWYTNVPDKLIDSAGDAAANLGLYPRGPFREVQLFIDSKLAGIAHPYPVIFTGGISPLLWRPMAAYGAFDQPTYYIDITPFVGTLTDGKEHEFRLNVVSAEANQTINTSWFVSGNVQYTLASSSERTTGSVTVHDAPLAGDYSIEGAVQNSTSLHLTANVHTKRPRKIHIEGTVKTGDDAVAKTAKWTQEFKYSNAMEILGATGQSIKQTSSGVSQSTHASLPFLASTFSYPLSVSIFTDAVSTLNTSIEHRFDTTLVMLDASFGEPVEQGTAVQRTARSRATLRNGGISGGNGESATRFQYKDSNAYTFDRSARTNGTQVTSQHASGTLAERAPPITAPDLRYLQRVATSPDPAALVDQASV